MKSGLRTAYWIGVLITFFVFGLIHTVPAREFGLGDIPLAPETYQKYLKILKIRALPVSYDARDEGIVTPPKDQGSCGSCWAFASAGAFESHLSKEFGVELIDLSEQQQVSCNRDMGGCCGGSAEAIRYWENRGPIKESCFPYEESKTSCPIRKTVRCWRSIRCQQLSYHVTNYHTIDTGDTTQVKSSLFNDGPSYFRYDVYDDFYDFWGSGNPGDVYVNKAGTSNLGGHAVLIIGWDDDKGACLFKNSWGATGGPNGDGTFWMAYEGHANDLGFGMANFDLVQPEAGEAAPSITVRNNITTTWGNIRKN